MKVKISILLLIIIIIVVTIMGINFLLQPKEILEIVKERNLNETTNEKIKTELEGKIDLDLQEQEQKFKEKINEYISKIYIGTYTYMSEFNNINLANEQWIWECAYINLVNFEELYTAMTVTKEDVEMSARQLFGDDLQKEFPKEGLEFWLEPEGDGYFYAAAGIESDFYNDYQILSYKKSDKDIIVNIVEYKYNQYWLGEPTELNLYKINSDKVIKTYSLNNIITNDNYDDFMSSKVSEAMTFVKENPELFSTATVTLEYDEQNDLLYIKSFER